MTLAQKKLRAWAYGLADSIISRTMLGLTDPDLRARAVKTVLDDLRPGMGELVRQRTVVYARHGHTYKAALREAIAEQLMKMAASKMASYGERLAGYGLGTTAADKQAAAADSSSGSSFGSITSGITDGVSGILGGAMNIYSTVESNRQERRELAAAQSRWSQETAYTDLERSRQYGLSLAELESTETLELARLGAEERTLALQASIAAQEPAPAGPALPPRPPADDDDSSGILIVGGVVVLAMFGGLIYLATRDDEDKDKE